MGKFHRETASPPQMHYFPNSIPKRTCIPRAPCLLITGWMLLYAHPPHAYQVFKLPLSLFTSIIAPENSPCGGRRPSVLISTCNCWPIKLVPLPSPPTTLSFFPLWLFPSPLSVSVRVFIGEKKNYFLKLSWMNEKKYLSRRSLQTYPRIIIGTDWLLCSSLVKAGNGATLSHRIDS